MKRSRNKRRKISKQKRIVEVIDDSKDGDFIPQEDENNEDDVYMNDLEEEEEEEEEGLFRYPNMLDEEKESENNENLSNGEQFQVEIWRLIKYAALRNLKNFHNSQGVGRKRKKSKITTKYEEFQKIDSTMEKIKYMIDKFPLGVGWYWQSPIEYGVRNSRLKDLTTIYCNHYEERKLSKDTMVKEVLMKFYGKMSNMEKRQIEDENIKSIDSYMKDEDFRFFSLCGFTLPNEIIEQILFYLPRDLEVLSNVGGACQYLYLKLLTSWDKIDINGDNLYKTSTLAIQNVKAIRISKMTQMDQNYLFEYLRGQKLRSLSIIGDTAFVRSALNNISKLKTKKKKRRKKKTKKKEKIVKEEIPLVYPFSNLEKLEISELWCYLRNSIRPLKFSFNEIFPSIKTIKGLRSKYLFPILQKTKGIEEYDFNLNRIENEDLIIKNIGDKNAVKSLILRFDPNERNYSKSIDLINSLSNLRKLRLIFPIERFFRWRKQDSKVFDFSEFICPSQSNLGQGIEEFEITNQEDEGDSKEYDFSRSGRVVDEFRHEKDYSRPVILHNMHEPNKNLEKLIILSSKIRNKHFFILDFNLEEMFESKFFFQYTTKGKLREFVGDVPIMSRHKRVIKLVEEGKEPLKIGYDTNAFREYVGALYDNHRTNTALGQKNEKKEKKEKKKKKKRKKEPKLLDFGNEVVCVILQFTEFLRSTIHNFRKFHLIVRNRDLWFKNEKLEIFYDSYIGIRRLRMKYFQGEEILMKDVVNKHFKTIGGNIGMGKKVDLLLNEKRPSLFLFLEIIEWFLIENLKNEKIINVLDFSMDILISDHFYDRLEEYFKEKKKLMKNYDLEFGVSGFILSVKSVSSRI